MAIGVITTITADQPFTWLHRHDGQVDIIEASYSEATSISVGTVTGPYQSESEAIEHLRDIISLP